MLDPWEVQQMEKAQSQVHLARDALSRMEDQFTADNLVTNGWDYSIIQLTKARAALEKVRTMMLAVRNRRQADPRCSGGEL